MRYSIFFSAIVLIFCSCADNSKNGFVSFQSAINSFGQSNKIIDHSTDDIRKELADKRNDMRLFERAGIWYPIAVKVSEFTTAAISDIIGLKSQLISEIGDSNLIFEAGYFKSVEKIFFQKEQGKKLYKTLIKCIDSISIINPELNTVVIGKVKNDYEYLNISKNDSDAFLKSFFRGSSAAKVLCVLAKFENDVKNIENRTIEFCNNQVTIFCGLGYERFNAVLGQSSNYLKAGDYLELSAGIGTFSTAAQPTFYVDGKIINCNAEGVMTYKFKTPLKAGNYSKPVKIEYTKPDGTKESKEYIIEYTVIDPNQK